MLVNFRFKNFRSFYNETNLSLQATKNKELREFNTFEVDEKLLGKNNNELIKSAVIFGSNASGKTNVIRALTYMLNCIRLSAANPLPFIKGNEYFAFYDEASKEESLYEVEIIKNNAYYRYGFTIKEGKITNEWLDRKVERITNIFKRDVEKISINGQEQGLMGLIKIPAETLFLSIANNFNLKNIEYIKDVIAWFNSLLIVFENNANSLDIYSLEGGKYHDQALEILKKADIGIKSFEVEKDKIANVLNPNDVLALNTQMQINPEKYMGQLKQEQENLYKIDLKTFFNVFDKNNNVVGQKEIKLIKDIGFNSEGTVRLLNYLGWILAALDKGRVILIDEIDSKLHFLVADYLINLFNSIDNNPKNSQLICTAHNIMLLDKDLRRDQIYLTCKDDFGVSKLTCLSDYKGVRKNDLFSKKYLAGFYSNLPYMGK